MIVVERKPVPIYEVECYECHSKIEYKRADVSTCHIRCPVCGCSLWANMISPSSYSVGGADTSEEVSQEIIDRLAAYEDTGWTPDEIREGNALIAEAVRENGRFTGRRLFELCGAESEGRLLVLPCAVRGRMYAFEFGNIREVIVNQFFYDGSSIVVNYYYNHFGHVEGTGIYGKTVFLTSEEAAEACNGRVNDG